MSFTVQTLKSALAIAQNLHIQAIANDDDLMAGKWQAEIDRISVDLRVAKDRNVTK
tara:strand:+ start:188 stop:355 length:168 start_codon:yes stop_codon:yes gene_type:complete